MMVFVVALISYIIYLAAIEPTNHYQFETITKVSEKYDEPVYLSFHWDVADAELRTGAQVTIWTEAYNLPYNSTNASKKIQVKFEGIGYWKGSADKLIDRISKEENVTLQPKSGEDNVFKSNSITVRYTTEGMKGVLFCDYNIEPVCTAVPDVIEVAPHATSFQIDTARTSHIVAVSLMTFAVITIWLMIRHEYIITKKNNHMD